MEDAIEEMKKAIRNYILETNYDEMDEDARTEKFWQDLGENFFSDEEIEDSLVKRTVEEIGAQMQRASREELGEKRTETVFQLLKKMRDKRRQEREEIGEEAFIKKYPPLIFEEKREKIIEIMKKKHQERISTKE